MKMLYVISYLLSQLSYGQPTTYYCTTQTVSGGASKYFRPLDKILINLSDPVRIVPEIKHSDGTYSRWMTFAHPYYGVQGTIPKTLQYFLLGEIKGFERSTIEIENEPITPYTNEYGAWFRFELSYLSSGIWSANLYAICTIA